MLMKKHLNTILNTICICITSISLNACNGDKKSEILPYTWTWMSGEPFILDILGSYGSGSPITSGQIGARIGSATWVDNQGNLWIFGGSKSNYMYKNNIQLFNDLWKYSLIDGRWFWIKGSNTYNSGSVSGGSITPPGSINKNNTPSARAFASSVTDKDGNLWLFGGYTIVNSNQEVSLNDLWKYDPKIDSWQWMSGALSSQATIATTITQPGSRYASSIWSIDKNLYLFGGIGTDTGSHVGFLQDLWQYNTNNNMWQLLSNPAIINHVNKPSIAPQQNVANQSNIPSGRINTVSVVNNNNLWLFGGVGCNDTNCGSDSSANSGYYLNDLWKYDILQNQWTWVSGTLTGNKKPVVDINGSVIGSKSLATGWIDQNNNIFIYGGLGISDDDSVGLLSDLWKYNIDNNKWFLINGTTKANQTIITSGRGIANIKNTPGARNGAMGWFSNNNLWLFGGQTFNSDTSDITKANYLNDLWVFKLLPEQQIQP